MKDVVTAVGIYIVGKYVVEHYLTNLIGFLTIIGHGGFAV